MALLFWDGLDAYGTDYNAFMAARPQVSGILGGGYWSSTGGRYGGVAIGPNAAGGYLDISGWTTTCTEFYSGCAHYLNDNNVTMFAVYGNNATNDSYSDMYVQYSSGSLIVRNCINYAYTIINNAITSPAAVAPQIWNWWEFRVKQSSNLSTADGIFQVWVNGQLVWSNTAMIINGSTNVNSTYLKKLTLNPRAYGYSDDFYCLDTTGPAPWNTRLGDCRIASVAVNADAGPNDGTVSTGSTSHYTVVDEIPWASSPADYITIGGAASGAGEMFKTSSLPSTNVFSVLATAVVAVAQKTDAGNATFKLSLQSGSTRANSNTQYLSTSNSFYRQDWTTNPATSAQWSVAAVQAANVGIYIV